MSSLAGPVVDRSLLRLAARVLVLVSGTSTVLVGLVLVPLPGPGWPIVFVGISLLGREFAWARRLSGWVQTQAARVLARCRSRAARAGLGGFTALSVVVPVALLLR